MKRVRAALDRSTRVEVGRVPSAHRRELVAQRLGEEPVLHAAVVTPADELFLQALVHALGVSETGHEEHCDERRPEDAPRPNIRRALLQSVTGEPCPGQLVNRREVGGFRLFRRSPKLPHAREPTEATARLACSPYDATKQHHTDAPLHPLPAPLDLRPRSLGRSRALCRSACVRRSLGLGLWGGGGGDRAIDSWPSFEPSGSDAPAHRPSSRALPHQKIRGIKIGALGSRGNVEAVTQFLRTSSPQIPVVIDPVMRSTRGARGARLLEDGAKRALLDMIDLATVITPNISEAESFLGVADHQSRRRRERRSSFGEARSPRRAGERRPPEAERETFDIVDVSAVGKRIVRLRAPRVPGSIHGTGCTLASLSQADWRRANGSTTINRGCRSLGQAATEERTSPPDPHRHRTARARAMMTRGPRFIIALPPRASERLISPGVRAFAAPSRAGADDRDRARQLRSSPAASAVGPCGRRQRGSVFVGPLRSDEPAPRGAELAGKLAGWLAGALGGGASARAEPVSLATAQAIAHGKSLVYVEIEIARGQLRATADVYRTTRNVWDRARQPVPAPIAHAPLAVRIDGEIRSYLAPVPLVANRIEKATTEDRDLIAIACGDVDGDGALEIVTLGRRRAAIGRARAGRFVPSKIASLRDLSGIAPAPLREPLGGLAIVPARGARPAYIDLGITDRARGSRLDGDLRPIGSIAGVPFTTATGDACVTFQGSTLSATIAKCAEADGAFDTAGVEAPFDAAASAAFVTADGVVHGVGATRDPRTAEITLRSGTETATVPHAGAQIAVADLDQDGSPEIISTLDIPARAIDRRCRERCRRAGHHHLAAGNRPSREGAHAGPSGIRAVAACPPDGTGAAPIVLATAGELWIIR